MAYSGDHELYLLDALAAEVIVLGSDDGAVLRRFGSRGEGPGEFRSPVSIAVAPGGEVWVAEGYAGYHQVFDPEGRYLGRVPRADRVTPNGPPPLHVSESVVTYLGRQEGRWVVRRLRPDGEVLRTGPALPKEERADGLSRKGWGSTEEFSEVATRFLEYAIWSVGPDGAVWYGKRSDETLYRRALDGTVLDSIRVPDVDPEFSIAERRLIENGLASVGLRWADAEPVRPQVYQIIPFGDDIVLLQRVDEGGAPSRRIDLVEVGSSRWLGTFETPVPIMAVSLPLVVDDALFFIGEGAFGVPLLVKGTIRLDGDS